MTPGTLFSLACTRAAQAAQVIPPMTSSNPAVAGAAPARVPVAAMSVTSRWPAVTVLQITPGARGC